MDARVAVAIGLDGGAGSHGHRRVVDVRPAIQVRELSQHGEPRDVPHDAHVEAPIVDGGSRARCACRRRSRRRWRSRRTARPPSRSRRRSSGESAGSRSDAAPRGSSGGSRRARPATRSDRPLRRPPARRSRSRPPRRTSVRRRSPFRACATSMARVACPIAIFQADASSIGRPRLRARSFPEPSGTIPIAAGSPAESRPLTTSCTVPSPPTAITRSWP